MMRPCPGCWRLVAAAACALLVAVPARPAPATGQSSGDSEYPLYYSFAVPLSVPTIVLSDEGTKRSYSGALSGTLGGISVTEAKYTFGSGASKWAGGGTFSMTTKAGPVKDGRVLMTNDGKETTLLFVGTYLGARLSFSITNPGEQPGGSGVTASGLAETNFLSHEQYVAAVRNATAALSPAMREQIVADADQNLRLVRDYQHRPAPR